MKNRWKLWLWLLLLAATITAACSGGETSEAPADQPQGPALVMFYTEG